MNENARNNIEKILANMTNLPGVYRMLGKDGELLYVGKAKNLKNRVSSYFVKTIEHPKTQALVCPSSVNYLLFQAPTCLHTKLRAKKIAIRNCDNYVGLGPGWYRIAVRLHEENEALIRAIKEV